MDGIMTSDLNERGETSIGRLTSIFLHVTKACNLYCKYCYFSAHRPLHNELTTEEFDRLWQDVVELKPRKLVFTGGEPLLRNDIVDLLRGLQNADSEHCIVRCLNSNGHLVTRDLARELVGLADEVRISLDAFDLANDTLRGAGNFGAALKALETYYAVGFEPKVLVTVTKDSLPDLEQLLCFLINRQFVNINVNRFRPLGRGAGHTEWCVSETEVRQAIDRAWARCGFFKATSNESLETETQCSCGVGRFVNIMPNGDVFPCHTLTQPEFRCGNVRTESLLNICRSGGLLSKLPNVDFRDAARTDERFKPLTLRGACFGEVYASSGEPKLVWFNKLSLGAPTTD